MTVHDIPEYSLEGPLAQISDNVYSYHPKGHRRYRIKLASHNNEVMAITVIDDEGNTMSTDGANQREALLKMINKIHIQSSMGG